MNSLNLGLYRSNTDNGSGSGSGSGVFVNNVLVIYVPRVYYYVTTSQVKNEFNYQGIGRVHRVDFVDCVPNDEDIFVKNFGDEQKIFKRAFIYFEELYDTDIARWVYDNIIQDISQTITLQTLQGFWFLNKVHNPVPYTNLNKHQIVENCWLLEQKVKGLLKREEEFYQRLRDMEAKIQDLQAQNV